MTDTIANYFQLSEYYDSCLEKHGATPQGVDWPNQEDLKNRLNIMLDVIKCEDKNETMHILDLGCGYGALVDFLSQYKKLNDLITYTGMDISSKMITAATQQHPDHTFICRDILREPLDDKSYDYIIMNGVFTEKRSLEWHAMYQFMQDLIRAAFKACRKGIAFNVMSQHVDWSNPNLFHCSFNETAAAIISNCSRHFAFRADYGLYEYTAYVYRYPANQQHSL
jgi:SAM-dependent methyltransferase